MADAASPLLVGQQLLQDGDAAAAVKHLDQLARNPQGLGLDGHLLMAEALWQAAGPGGTTAALPHYEAAYDLACAASDNSKKAAVCLGHGFALIQLGESVAARTKLLQGKVLAQNDGNPAAVQFIDALLKQAEASMSPTEASKATWLGFAEAFSTNKPPVLFMRGSAKEPLDEAGAQGIQKLKEANVAAIKVIDVCDTGPDLPAGLQTLSDIGVDFPQLYIKAAPVRNWMELQAEDLANLLASNGVALRESNADAEPCHGAFSEGLEAWEVKLVNLISKEGATGWEQKLEVLRTEKLENCPSSASELEGAWKRLSPIVKEKLEAQPEMPCGHSCNTCPTKHDCHLHEAAGHTRDIEDLI
eukprot:CAMPEP_0197659694 /NCGR_PEP_ID=MMETSP1338-20131121/48673_1 /TAXON_ID=43686 ORGANISM="Pelagodinium beii, Strain RCC1491" /NCGR_SAMPLE_ID=MMETSP1338 /ASSEMBLY_ACC=CAM_ASM_000754 /LENGTH=358 /DNA_ID=CAMNT_0043236731 /DNA_START=68 /DNA_END=1144 /DNA_ORIENTATION=-